MGYRATSDGHIIGRSGKVLSAKPNKHGYIRVHLNMPSEHGSRSVHRLICEAFYGNAPHLQVNHKNGIKDDNRVENLEWCTPSENISHAIHVLKKKIGFQSGLTTTQVRVIYLDSRRHHEIAKEYGVSRTTVTAIKSGGTHKHIACQLGSPGKNRKGKKIMPEDAINIFHDTRKHHEIARDYNVSRTTVTEIKTGRTWNSATRCLTA